ncbi:MAG: TonB-dependent receptor [Bacteroidota bacterium]
MKFVWITLVFLCSILVTNAQYKPDGNKAGSGTDVPKGTISGVVIDKKNKVPIEFANVIVCRMKDTSMVTGALSNIKGKFIIDKVPFGKYIIKVNFIGFGTKFITEVMLKPDNSDVNIGTVELETSSTNLEAVTISGQKDQIEYNLDKKVINVDKNMLTSGGTALDVMQTIPSVNVDIDGTVSLRGSSNVTIFIDGRPSNLTSLDQMPAAMIDKVEVVTNPSARYDPDGMSGIINIVTKRKKEPGYNGMIAANVGTGGKYSGSLNLGYSRKKFNLFTNIDFRRMHSTSSSNLYRELFEGDTTTYFQQDNVGVRQGYFSNFKMGADYFINKSNTLSFTGTYNLRQFMPNDTTAYQNFDLNRVLSDFYRRSNFGKSNNNGFELSLDYKKTFARKGEELTSSLYASSSTGDSYTDLNTRWFRSDNTPIDSMFINQNTTNGNRNQSYLAQLDFVLPLDKWGRIETGYKGTYKISDNNYVLSQFIDNQWVKDSNSSNDFLYNEQIHAAYFIYGNNIKKFKFQLGLRAEQALTVSNQRTQDTIFHNNYFNVFPTVHLKYEFTDHNALQISYSRRVNRPRSGSLNPFINNTDPMNLSAGNPYLKPEFTNSFELEHLIDFKQTTINTTLFYRETENMITRMVTLMDGGVSMSTYANLNKGSSFGVELVVSQGLFKWWKMNANLSYFGLQYFGTTNVAGLNKVNTSWTAKVNSTMTFWKSLDVQLSFNFSAPQVTAQTGSDRGGISGGQGKQIANYSFDIGLKKDFFKSKLTFTLRLSDVFNTNQYQLTTHADNYYSVLNRYRETRVLYFGISYKINGGLKQKKRKTNGDDTLPDTEY